jgi:hypothetical protein
MDFTFFTSACLMKVYNPRPADGKSCTGLAVEPIAAFRGAKVDNETRYTACSAVKSRSGESRFELVLVI